MIVMPGSDLAETLLRMAFLRNVSQIVVGKPQESYLWGLVRPISLVDKLVKGSDQIDIYVVPAASGPGRNRWKSWHRKTEKDGRDYWLAAGVTAAVTGAGLLVSAFTGYFAPGFLYLAGVVGLGFFIRSRWAMLLAAALSVLLWNLLFIPPVMTFKIERLEDALSGKNGNGKKRPMPCSCIPGPLDPLRTCLPSFPSRRDRSARLWGCDWLS